MKKNITRILACALLVATLGLSLASCAAGDKVKDTAGKVWDTAVDGAEKIYDAAKDKMDGDKTTELSGNADHISLSAVENNNTTSPFLTNVKPGVPCYNVARAAGDGFLYFTPDEFASEYTISSVTLNNSQILLIQQFIGEIVYSSIADIFTADDYMNAEANENALVFKDSETGYLGIMAPSNYEGGVRGWLKDHPEFYVSTLPSYTVSYGAEWFANMADQYKLLKNAKGALYIESRDTYGTILDFSGAKKGDYREAEPGDKPVIAIDENNSKLCILLPKGYDDVATWAAATTDFHVTLSPVMQQTLQATVYPLNTPNKALEWSVSCSDDKVNTANYIRIVKSHSGKENAVDVIVLQPFDGMDFMITCKTVVGGYTANCALTYTGKLSGFVAFREMDNGSYQVHTLSRHLETGKTYTYRLIPDNIFHAVGTSHFEIESIGGEGSFTAVVSDGESQSTKEIDVADIVDFCFKVSLSGDTLTVTCYKGITEYTGVDGDKPMKYQSGGEKSYFTVSLVDSISGSRYCFGFRIDTVANSVQLSDGVLTF